MANPSGVSQGRIIAPASTATQAGDHFPESIDFIGISEGPCFQE
jgi:hypothetical protein